MKSCKRILTTTILSAALFLPTLLAAQTLYVVSPAAKLLSEPAASADGKPLSRGTVVNQTGQEGAFVRVEVGTENGWVSRLFLSPHAPTGNVALTDLQKNPGARVQTGGGAYTQTAAARGLAGGSGSAVDLSERYDFNAINFIESQVPNERTMTQFKAQGGLH